MQTAPQTAYMTLDTIPPPAAAPTRRRALQAFLALVALCQTASALYIVPIFFDDLSALLSQDLGGWITTANIALGLLAAVAALVFALTGRIRSSIVAIAALGLLDWVHFLSKIGRVGIEYHATLASIYEHASPVSVYEFAQVFIFPVLCVAAIVLAARNTRLVLATAMATISPVLSGIGWLTFVIMVSIYGF